MSNLLRGVSYGNSNQLPQLNLTEQIFYPLGKSFTLRFDLSNRYCLGWHDLATSESQACPNQAVIDPKYDTCPACQKRTGFNPAFYNASSVSPQQEKLNQEPHILYLAHFGDDYIKVGISRARRGIGRLLEQGARSALVLETFPSALIARQYESKIARLPGFHETTLAKTKLNFLEASYDPSQAAHQLDQAKSIIESSLKLSFKSPKPYALSHHYFAADYQPETFTQLNDRSIMAGKCLGVIGDIIIMSYDDHRLALPLKPLTGYPVSLSDSVAKLDFAPTQASLF